jgi:hypothetical protein
VVLLADELLDVAGRAALGRRVPQVELLESVPRATRACAVGSAFLRLAAAAEVEAALAERTSAGTSCGSMIGSHSILNQPSDCLERPLVVLRGDGVGAALDHHLRLDALDLLASGSAVSIGELPISVRGSS